VYLLEIAACQKTENSKGLKGVDLERANTVKNLGKVKHLCGACKSRFLNNVFLFFWKPFWVQFSKIPVFTPRKLCKGTFVPFLSKRGFLKGKFGGICSFYYHLYQCSLFLA
jgi:hypothetical protein